MGYVHLGARAVAFASASALTLALGTRVDSGRRIGPGVRALSLLVTSFFFLSLFYTVQHTTVARRPVFLCLFRLFLGPEL